MKETTGWARVVVSVAAVVAFAACGDSDVGVVGDASSDLGVDASADALADVGDASVDSAPDVADPVCGDGLPEGAEVCDDGNVVDGDGCASDCLSDETCGNGVADVAAAEVCDDGNTADGDGCSSDCLSDETCGNGVVDSSVGEVCDDGNTADGDGCQATCALPACGDGVVGADEVCDDGNTADGDGCSATCTSNETCGNEVVDSAVGETCDDGNTDVGDGCSDACGTEECGNGVVDFGEACDDGGESEACNADCSLAACGDGQVNAAAGEVCDTGGGDTEACTACRPTVCGDGIANPAVGEACDDGNWVPGDGCRFDCTVEFGWECDALSGRCVTTGVVSAMSLGLYGGCVLLDNGSLGCFGENPDGQVGNGTVDVETFLPEYTMEGVVAVAAGSRHVCAIDADSDVWCWGANTSMAAGSATSTDPLLEPTRVADLAPVQQVDVGDAHTCVIDDANEVWCWGRNNRGQSGQEDLTPQLPPERVPLGVDASDLGVGGSFSCAVTADRTVACWGDDSYGQLGDGTSGGFRFGPAVVPELSDISEVDAFDDTVCALDGDGTLWCWGRNNQGALGTGSEESHVAEPEEVPLPDPVVDFSVGLNFACALTSTNDVYCWGNAAYFQLGNRSMIHQSSPVRVIGLPAAVLTDVEAGWSGACVLTDAGERHCWGRTTEGDLGLAPELALAPAPVAFSGPFRTLVPSPFEFSGVLCAVMEDGTVECAGDGALTSSSSSTGALGIFGAPDAQHLAPPERVPGLSRIEQMGVGLGFACASTATGLSCWGDNGNRQLGQGEATDDSATPLAMRTLGAIDELAVGSLFACVRARGTVQCWGDGSDGQTGVDGTEDQGRPVSLQGVNDAVDIELGSRHGCLLRATGGVSCWGNDGAGQLGDGDDDSDDSPTPVAVVGLPAAASDLAVGNDHACALVDGAVYCWGSGFHQQLGQEEGGNSDVALRVSLPRGVRQIEAGAHHTCALTMSDQLWCWGGQQRDGRHGDGGIVLHPEAPDVAVPVRFEAIARVPRRGDSDPPITDIVLSHTYTCVEVDGEWGCVGFRGAGQLADGTTLEPSTPVPTSFGP